MQNRTIKAARIPRSYNYEAVAFILGFVAAKLFGFSMVLVLALGVFLLGWIWLTTVAHENTFAEFLEGGIKIFVTKPWFAERTIPYSQILFIHFTQSDVQREFGVATLNLRSVDGKTRVRNIREHAELKAFLIQKLN